MEHGQAESQNRAWHRRSGKAVERTHRWDKAEVLTDIPRVQLSSDLWYWRFLDGWMDGCTDDGVNGSTTGMRGRESERLCFGSTEPPTIPLLLCIGCEHCIGMGACSGHVEVNKAWMNQWSSGVCILQTKGVRCACLVSYVY